MSERDESDDPHWVFIHPDQMAELAELVAAKLQRRPPEIPNDMAPHPNEEAFLAQARAKAAADMADRKAGRHGAMAAEVIPVDDDQEEKS